MRTAMSNETKKTGSSFMEKLSTVIVDKRNLIFLLTIILLVFSAFSRNWVEVESDLTYYLPSDSETKQALDIMDGQFTTYGTAEVMVANITPEQAAALEPKIKEIKGVQSVDYDETFGFEADLHPKNIIDNKHFEVKTPDVVIKVNPERTDLINTKMIDGRQCLVIELDGNIEVNGIAVRAAGSEASDNSIED